MSYEKNVEEKSIPGDDLYDLVRFLNICIDAQI